MIFILFFFFVFVFSSLERDIQILNAFFYYIFFKKKKNNDEIRNGRVLK